MAGLKPDEQGGDAHAFTVEVCRGNRDAVIFCTLWYRYCHGIDDLIDCKEDGRPTMSNEEILALFINAAELYNSKFYREFSQMLVGIVMTVTNAYADSVAWEKDPQTHRRVIADVLRTCGDEMFFMVAYVCGGWQHMRSVSGRIRERDWIYQHTKPDDFH